MKLLSFEIQNYKCIESVVASECSNLTTFIGRNSSGKTGVFEALRYIRQIHKSIPGDKLREITHCVTEETFSVLAETDIFKKVQIKLKLRIKGSQATHSNLDNVLILDSMSVPNSTGEFVSFLVDYINYENYALLDVNTFPFYQNPEPSQLAPEMIDIELKEILEKEVLKISPDYRAPLKSFSLQGRIIQDVINNIKSIEAIRESSKRILMAYKRDAGERGSNLIGLMDTLFRRDHQRFLYILDICKKIFPDIKDIHPELVTLLNKIVS